MFSAVIVSNKKIKATVVVVVINFTRSATSNYEGSKDIEQKVGLQSPTSVLGGF